MELTEDDVLKILRLFEQSTFDFLQLEHGERKITVSKAGYGGVVPASPASVPAAARSVIATAPQPAAASPAAGPVAKPEIVSVDPGLVPISAPMVGKFYSAASPSDPVYVLVGSKVEAGATVGLIEVMKVFASVKTEIAGTIERILVMNGEFVESGQPLFLIRPER
jgi:acetyl-CoA carboxylase biotin carboxyl carrier protein